MKNLIFPQLPTADFFAKDYGNKQKHLKAIKRESKGRKDIK